MDMAKAKKNDHFNKKYTMSQLEKFEANSFIILLKGDLFSHGGKHIFSKSKAEQYYSDILNGLMDIYFNGDSQLDKEDAAACLFHLKILPFRMH